MTTQNRNTTVVTLTAPAMTRRKRFLTPLLVLALASFVSFSILVANSDADFIQPSTINSTGAGFTNTPAVLINAATANGGTNYAAPGASGGGGGTSWHTMAHLKKSDTQQ